MGCISCGGLCSSTFCANCEDAPDFSPCPKCGGDVADWDGFGVLHHAPCGYCKHASVVDHVCQFCGKVVE